MLVLSLSVTSGGRAGLGFPVCQGQELAACLPLLLGHYTQCQPRPQGSVCCSTACGANSAALCSASQLSSLCAASLFCFCLLSLPCAFLATSTRVSFWWGCAHFSGGWPGALAQAVLMLTAFSWAVPEGDRSIRIPYLKPGGFPPGWGRAGDAPSSPSCVWNCYSRARGKCEQWAQGCLIFGRLSLSYELRNTEIPSFWRVKAHRRSCGPRQRRTNPLKVLSSLETFTLDRCSQSWELQETCRVAYLHIEEGGSYCRAQHMGCGSITRSLHVAQLGAVRCKRA